MNSSAKSVGRFSGQPYQRPQAARAAAKLSLSKALVWVDMEPLLIAERAKCRKANEKLSEIKKQVDDFRELDEPAYMQWFHSKFGQEITACREMDERYIERASLIRDVRIEAMRHECSEREAYARLMERRERQSFGQSFGGADDDDEQLSFGDIQDDFESLGMTDHELAEQIRKFRFDPAELKDIRNQFESQMGEPTGWEEEYEILFQEYILEYIKIQIVEAEKKKHKAERESSSKQSSSKSDSEWGDGGQQKSGGRSKSKNSSKNVDDEEFVAQKHAPKHPEADQIKAIYRTLARRLHPDVNASLTKAELHLWYDVQAAYESSDLFRLESLLAMVEQDGSEASSDKRGLDFVGSVSRLRMMLKDFDKKLRALRKQLRNHEQSAAWEFRIILKDPKRLKKRTNEIQRDLRYDLEEMHDAVMQMDEIVESWSRARPRSRRRK